MKLRLPRAIPGPLPIDERPPEATIQIGDQPERVVRWHLDDPGALSPQHAGKQTSLVNGHLEFPESINEQTQRFSIEVRYQVPKAFATTREQHKVVYGYAEGVERCEYVSIPLDVLAKRLQITVSFTPSQDCAGFSTPKVAKLSTFSLRPQGIIGCDADPVAEHETVPWPLHVEGQARMWWAERTVKLDVKAEQRDNTEMLVMTVNGPLPSARYYLRWELPSVNSLRPSHPVITEKIGRAERARDRLLQHAVDLTRPLSEQRLGNYLTKIRKAILESPLAGVRDEQLEVGMATFDPSERVLRLCAGDFEPGVDHTKETYIPGEGVIGFAFKNKQPLLWWPRYGLELPPHHTRCIYRRPHGYKRDHDPSSTPRNRKS